MFVERPLSILRFYYSGAIWRIKQREKTIYLTFDDGPIPEVTPLVLDILDKYNIKATFFCVGENVYKHPDVFEEVKRRGHHVGNHTYNHLKGFVTSLENYMDNVQKADEQIHSHLFRPPYGRIKRSQLHALTKKYRVVLWDLVTRDYNKKLSPEFIMKNVRRLSRNGSVVVFHDSLKAEKNMLAVLPQAIEYWQSKGYQFDTL